jgi:hypothetical protein
MVKLKSCKKGWSRSRETQRCYQRSKPGYERHPVTKTWIKKCVKGKRRNTDTMRCVSSRSPKKFVKKKSVKKKSVKKKSVKKKSVVGHKENLGQKDFECKLIDKSLSLFGKDIKVFSNNICGMYNSIKTVKGFPSDSASPTDSWLLFFKNNVYYGDRKISRAFLKWWINPTTIKKDRNIDKESIDTIKGLDYEIKVYRDVIKPIIDAKICPNFVMFLASGTDCLYEDMEKMLMAGVGSNIKAKDVETNILRNMTFMYDTEKSYKAGTRPAIESNKKISIHKTVKDSFIYPWTYNLLMTENAKPGTVCIEKFFDQEMNYKNDKVMLPVMFQVIMGCYVMSLSYMTHNDTHTQNIFVEPRLKMEKVSYIVNGEIYTFETKYKVLIFDFDRAYVKRLGENPINIKSCQYRNHCNEFVNNKDALKTLANFHPGYGSSYEEAYFFNKISHYFMSSKHEEKFESISYNENGMLMLSEHRRMKPKDFEKYYHIEKILYNFGEEMRYLGISKSSISGVDKGLIYKCDKSMFDANGTIKQSNKTDTIPSKDTIKSLLEKAVDITDLVKERLKQTKIKLSHYKGCKKNKDNISAFLKSSEINMKDLLKMILEIAKSTAKVDVEKLRKLRRLLQIIDKRSVDLVEML